MRAYITSLPPFSESEFAALLQNDLGVEQGDIVFVHSSTDRLNLAFPVVRVVSILLDVIGNSGTLLFPTYPRLGSLEFLRKGEVFDIRKTPSYSGMISEAARRHPKALRSLHPTKSVCAIGPAAAELVSTHQFSSFPYAAGSPYYKAMELRGKAIGIGVSTNSLAFVHCVEDVLQEDYPHRVYDAQFFSGRCVTYDGKEQIVKTYAHDLRLMRTENTPRFMKHFVPQCVCQDLTVNGMQFFRADLAPLFHAMADLAKAGITIYGPWPLLVSFRNGKPPATRNQANRPAA